MTLCLTAFLEARSFPDVLGLHLAGWDVVDGEMLHERRLFAVNG
jgi:hypothetical protein